jgi:hypothetical protein
MSERLWRNGSPFFLQSCSQSCFSCGVLVSGAKSLFYIIPQVFYGIRVRTPGWAIHFWNLVAHKPFPHRPCFMAGSIAMLIQKIVITKLVFYRRRYAMGITRGPSPFHEKHPHAVMPPPPNFTVGTTHAGRYHSPGIHHTKTLPLDRHMV